MSESVSIYLDDVRRLWAEGKLTHGEVISPATAKNQEGELIVQGLTMRTEGKEALLQSQKSDTEHLWRGQGVFAEREVVARRFTNRRASL